MNIVDRGVATMMWLISTWGLSYQNHASCGELMEFNELYFFILIILWTAFWNYLSSNIWEVKE